MYMLNSNETRYYFHNIGSEKVVIKDYKHRQIGFVINDYSDLRGEHYTLHDENGLGLKVFKKTDTADIDFVIEDWKGKVLGTGMNEHGMRKSKIVIMSELNEPTFECEKSVIRTTKNSLDNVAYYTSYSPHDDAVFDIVNLSINRKLLFGSLLCMKKGLAIAHDPTLFG